MQDLTSIYGDIKRKIRENQHEPAFIYTGIGTAAGMRNANGGLDLANYHQYPPLLQEIKHTLPTLHLFIVLIDPYQEKPPFMVQDNTIHDVMVNNNKNNNNNNEEQCIFYDENKKITVYTLHKNVTAKPYIDYLQINNQHQHQQEQKKIDITDDLRDLNQFAIEGVQNVTTLYHDFTGRRNDTIAEYFDEEIDADELDHIIYGLSTREDHGCYFDLTAAGSFMPFRLIQENGIHRVSLFNIFKYIRTTKNDLRMQIHMPPLIKDASIYYPSVQDQMKINMQRDSVLLQIKNDFKNNIFNTMRILLKLIRGEEKKEDINNIYIFGYIEHTKRPYIEEKFGDGHYRELFDYLMDLFSKKMDLVVKLKDYDITGRELLGFVINEYEKNMYNWYTTLNYFIPS